MSMRISPIDIQQHKFKTRALGYDKAGVDQFLEALAEELERLIRKNQDLQEELDRTNASLTEMKDREETLKQTLVTTQKVTEELKSTARREVDVMMAEAEVKAERLMHNAEERRLQLIEEIQEIKRQKVDFEVGLRGLLEKHIRLLDLNAVAIEQQDAEARLLEEPLPFAQDKSTQVQEDKVAESAASHSVKSFFEADFSPQSSGVTAAADALDADLSAASELTFEFEQGDTDDEGDLLK